jgi:hypothetical protein
MIITNIITMIFFTIEMFFFTMYLLLIFSYIYIYIYIVAASTGKVTTSEYWEH